jgi:hypothetical protein
MELWVTSPKIAPKFPEKENIKKDFSWNKL